VATESEIGVVRASTTTGRTCVSLIGVPIFTFPSYQVFRTWSNAQQNGCAWTASEDNEQTAIRCERERHGPVLVLHRERENEGLTQFTTALPACAVLESKRPQNSTDVVGAIDSLTRRLSMDGNLQAKAIADSASKVAMAGTYVGNLIGDKLKAIGDGMAGIGSVGGNLGKQESRSLSKEISSGLLEPVRQIESGNRLTTDALVQAFKDDQSAMTAGLQEIAQETKGLEDVLSDVKSQLSIQNCVLAESRLAVAGVGYMASQREKMYQKFADSCKLRLTDLRK